jgi:hypothetical protein
LIFKALSISHVEVPTEGSLNLLACLGGISGDLIFE